MGLAERIEDLTGLLIALTIYLIVRWAQRKWPGPPGNGKGDDGGNVTDA